MSSTDSRSLSTQMDAVYYAAPAPTSLRALTLLGLVFDRLIFPDVYIPDGGIDLDATAKEIERIRALPARQRGGVDSIHMLNLMQLAINAEHLRDFCIFTGRVGSLGPNEPGAKELAFELEEAIYGPPPEKFMPMVSSSFAKGLPGGSGQQSSVNAF